MEGKEWTDGKVNEWAGKRDGLTSREREREREDESERRHVVGCHPGKGEREEKELRMV